MTNKTYNIIKWIARYLLPASATLYFALSAIWGLPYGEQVVGTLSALTIFLGVILGVSTAEYNRKDHSDGTLQIDSSNWDIDKYKLELTTGLDEIRDKEHIELKIERNANISREEHTL